MKFFGALIVAATASMTHAQMFTAPTLPPTSSVSFFLDTPACDAGYTAPAKKGKAVDEAWNWIDNASDQLQEAADNLTQKGEDAIEELKNIIDSLNN
jgi:hypothetical protein